jgi:ribose 5-phosphate isomerase A
MDLKRMAAGRALELVQDGMCLGLGSGTTTSIFIDLLGESYQHGMLRNISGVPTSLASSEKARGYGIPLVSLEDYPALDLAVDGADQVDPQLNLIKGLGKALLREKIVEIHARRLVIVVDDSKLVPRLGSLGPLPVEVAPFEVQVQLRWLQTLGCQAELWLDKAGIPLVTENHNNLVRCWFDGGIPDPYALNRLLADRPGVVENGLFLDMADLVIVGSAKGLRELKRPG